MVTDLFGTLLAELGPLIEAADLHPDRNNSCLITLQSGIQIQLELDKSGQFLILGSDLGSILQQGKYRENLFQEALKANDLPYPTHGILAYSKKTDHLVLFEKINIRDLTGEKIAAQVTPFLEKAALWSDALKRSEVPSVNQAVTGGRGPGMFGLRP
jgi:Tir chaperone protein (CesT) family